MKKKDHGTNLCRSSRKRPGKTCLVVLVRLIDVSSLEKKVARMFYLSSCFGSVHKSVVRYTVRKEETTDFKSVYLSKQHDMDSSKF